MTAVLQVTQFANKFTNDSAYVHTRDIVYSQFTTKCNISSLILWLVGYPESCGHSVELNLQAVYRTNFNKRCWHPYIFGNLRKKN